MADLKNDWQESDIVMNTDMNDIANAINSKLNSDFSNVSGGAVPVANGGTGATTSEAARNNLGIGESSIPKLGSLELSNDTPYIDFHYNNTSDDFNTRIINDGYNALNIKANAGNAKLKINDNVVITEASTEHNLYNIYLNGTNIDTDTERNYTTGLSEDSYGTRPSSQWQNIFNIKGGHFRAQIAIEATSTTGTSDINFWFRSKYLESGWSSWVCTSKTFVKETEPGNAPDNSLWAW